MIVLLHLLRPQYLSPQPQYVDICYTENLSGFSLAMFFSEVTLSFISVFEHKSWNMFPQNVAQFRYKATAKMSEASNLFFGFNLRSFEYLNLLQ